MVLVITQHNAVISFCHFALQGKGTILSASCLDSACTLIKRMHPAQALVDHALLKADASDISRLISAYPAIRIIVLNLPQSDPVELALIKAGVKGICHQNVSPDHLRKACLAVMEGELWIRRSLISKLLASQSEERSVHASSASCEHGACLDSLTNREKEIALMVSAGNSNREVSLQLGIAERTVKAHLTEIFRKLGVGDRLSMTVRMHRGGDSLMLTHEIQALSAQLRHDARCRDNPLRAEPNQASYGLSALVPAPGTPLPASEPQRIAAGPAASATQLH